MYIYIYIYTCIYLLYYILHISACHKMRVTGPPAPGNRKVSWERCDGSRAVSASCGSCNVSYAILFYTILYYTRLLYYTILYYTILYYTTLIAPFVRAESRVRRHLPDARLLSEVVNDVAIRGGP